MQPLRMATHPKAPETVPLFCREPSAGAAIHAPADGAPPPLLPAVLPDDDEVEDSFNEPVFMDYSIAGVPPNAPLMPGMRLLRRLLPRARSA